MKNSRFMFRVWNKNTHSFTTGGAIKFGGLCFVDEEDFGIKLAEGQDNYIIEQCTGLKDKNGNLIYEGDIVKGRLFNPWHTETPNPKVKGVVCFVQDRMTWIIEDGEDGYDFEDCMEEYFEIVGNIHEHKEQQ